MKEILRSMTKGCYDIQKLRIQTGNRIVANFKTKLGMEPSTKESDSEPEAQEVLRVIRLTYDRLTDGVEKITKRRKFDYDGVISNYSELCLVRQYEGLIQNEEEHFKKLGNTLENFEIWTKWLKGVKGVGPAMGAVIISEIDIEIAKYPSSIWKYAGLDVVNGKGRSRKKEHLEETEYEDAEGNIKTKKGITFNPFLKTKLVGVLGPSFLRAGGTYSDVYYDYKNRISSDPRHEEKSKGHIHNMAIRYMVKMFLKDLYSEWKEIEGLPQSPTYHEAKQGHEHSV